MIRTALVVAVATCVASLPALAEDSSSAENTGVGLGLILGGVAGGPVGAIVGAAFGAKVGDEFQERNEHVDSLAASLNATEQQVAALEKDILSLNGELRLRDGELQLARSQARPEMLSLLQAGIAMDLLFRTDEDTLAHATGGKLQQLAQSLTNNPDIRIRLDGFADERGDADYNQALSARRAAHVRDILVANGVPASRISVNALGESAAVEQTNDSFALERRVALTLYVGDIPSFASNPK